MLNLEKLDSNEVDFFAESDLEHFSFILKRSSSKILEHEKNVNFNGVKCD